ncbi:MAG: hypothetical protein WBM36_13660 [Lysobacterales bacterium]
MGDKNQLEFEGDDLDTLDDFDDDLDFDASSDEPEVLTRKDKSVEQRRLAARRKIERRNELRALNSALDEWDDELDEWDILVDEDDL